MSLNVQLKYRGVFASILGHSFNEQRSEAKEAEYEQLSGN